MQTTTLAARTVADDISYEDLYRRWELGNWSAHALDFSRDPDDWHGRFDEFERRAALWNYTMFLHGEGAVAEELSPFVDAAPLEEQKYFLSTQQVDEARHSVFFHRFVHEVVEAGDGSLAGTFEATRPELSWGFRKTFGHLRKVTDELRRDRSAPMLARAVTMYHLVVEATLAQPGQHFIESYLIERDVLPGLREGMGLIARDEQRHIAFGVKCLADLSRRDPECAHAVADLLREILPISVSLLVPPNWDMRYLEVFGSSLADVYVHGMQSLEQRLRAAGLPLEELPGAPVVPVGLTHEERVGRSLTMLRAAYLGEKVGPPSRDPDMMLVLFDTIARSVDASAVPPGTTLQWEFPDADPWFVRLDNGSTRAQPGRAERADLTLRCRFEDWVDISAGRTSPRRALATGRLRVRGRPRAMLRMQRLFGR